MEVCWSYDKCGPVAALSLVAAVWSNPPQVWCEFNLTRRRTSLIFWDPGSSEDDYPVYEFICLINYSFMFIGCLLIVSEITRIGKEFSLNF